MEAPSLRALRKAPGEVFRSDCPLGKVDSGDSGWPLAAKILLPRARRVYLPAAAPWPSDSEKLVHDVRVASRRLVEALALLAPVLPSGPRKKATLRARRLRSALGEARMSAVRTFELEYLAQRAGVELPPELTTPSTAALDAGVQEARSALPAEKLLRHGAACARLAARASPDLPFRDLAARHLYRRTEIADERAEPLADPQRAGEHHRLRVSLKRLRYTVELLRPLLTESSEGWVTALKRAQDRLGSLNDVVDASAWLEATPGISAELRQALLTEARHVQHERWAAALDEHRTTTAPLTRDLRGLSGRIGRFAR